MRVLFSCLVALLLLAGCAGTTEIGLGPSVEGFYLGTATIQGPEGPITSAAFAEVDAAGKVTLSTATGYDSAITPSDEGYVVFIGGGLVITNAEVDVIPMDNRLQVTVRHSGQSILTADLERAEHPTLGTQTITPGPGMYAGNLLSLRNGKAEEIDPVREAQVQADGTWYAVTGGGVTVTGTFQPAGVVTDSWLIRNGSVFGLEGTTYSNDGESLIIRMPVGENSTFLVLRPIS